MSESAQAFSSPLAVSQARKIFTVLALFAFAPLLPALESDSGIDFLINPVFRFTHSNAPLNPGNFLKRENLVNRAKTSFWFNVYGDYLEFSGIFEAGIDSTKSKRFIEEITGNSDRSGIADTYAGFEQLYLQWSLPGNWALGAGKYPIRYGFSTVYAPMNYTARDTDFKDTDGQWNIWLSGQVGSLVYSLNYFPVIEMKQDPNDKNDVERFFSWTETKLKRQTMSLKLSQFLFSSLETDLIFFVQEKETYEFKELKNIYLAGSLGLSWNVSDRFTVRAETLVGNGFNDIKKVQISSKNPAQLPQYDYTDRDLDTYKVKALGGFTVILPLEVELSMEYFYNGAGYSRSELDDFLSAAEDSESKYNIDSSGAAHKAFLGNGWKNWKIYDMGQHYIFMQLMRRGIGNKLDFLNTSILMVSDISFYNSTQLTYYFDEYLSFGALFNFFLFEKGDAFSFSANLSEIVLSMKYSM